MQEIAAEVRQIIADMDQSVLDIGEARSLPPKIYTSPGFYEFEKEAIFYREWLGVGHQSQIPNPRDYFTVTVVDEPLIVVRQEDGSIKVLSAICRHRGHPVIPGEDHNPKNCRAFTCPYHHWTYGIDGQLRGALEMNRTVDIRKHCAETRLPELKVEIFHGLIYPPETKKMKHFDWAYEGQRAATGAFGVQDERTNRLYQHGLRSKFAPRGRLCHLEGTLLELNRWLLRRYTKYLDEVDALDVAPPRDIRSA